MLSLVPKDEGASIDLDKAVILIGRHPGCDAVLLSSRKVSRKHCCLAQVGDRFLLRDLGSTNGVTVNGSRVREAEIKRGDEVTIADLQYTVHLDGATSNGDHSRKPAPEQEEKPAQIPPQPEDLSQEFPVALPEDDVELADDRPAPRDPEEERSDSGFLSA